MTISHRHFKQAVLSVALVAVCGQSLAADAGGVGIGAAPEGIPLSALVDPPAPSLSAERIKALQDGFECNDCGTGWAASSGVPSGGAATPPSPTMPGSGIANTRTPTIEAGPASLASAGPTSSPVVKHKGAALYASAIEAAAKAYGLDPAIIHAVIYQESRYNPKAVSNKGAKGLMQLMDGLSAQFNIDPFDPTANIRVGAQYLAQQVTKFGSIELALAAYNAGPGAVQKYGGIPPYRETRDYVTKITSSLGLRR